MWNRLKKVALGLIGPILFVIAWWALPHLGIVEPMFAPGPFKIAHRLVILLGESSAQRDLVATILRFVVCFFLSALWGIPAGLVLGYCTKLYGAFELVIDFFRSLPAVALVPLALVVAPDAEGARLAIVVFSCGLVVLIGTAYGVKNCGTTRLQVASIAGASAYQRFRTVVLMEALPEIASALRVALSYTLVLVIVAEMFIGATSGLGTAMVYSESSLTREVDTYAFVLLTGLLGYTANRIWLLIETKILHWRGKA